MSIEGDGSRQFYDRINTIINVVSLAFMIGGGLWAVFTMKEQIDLNMQSVTFQIGKISDDLGRYENSTTAWLKSLEARVDQDKGPAHD